MGDKDPFGKSACEAEVKLLGTKYSALYFDETPFNDVAIEDDIYLIIGRRGAGKTALAQYFSFQRIKPDPLCIEVNRPDIYQEVLSDISRKASASRPAAVAHLKRVWEYILWSLVAAALRPEAPELEVVCDIEVTPGRLAHFVADVIGKLMEFFSGDSASVIGPRLEKIVDEAGLEYVKEVALATAKRRPIIVALDTLEQYDISNEALMNALAALIEYASDFSLEYARSNIFLKVFVAGEVFPHLQEAVLLNPSKVVNHPVYLLWRPRDLLRLICWRFYRHLEETQQLRGGLAKSIRWENDDDVMEKIWRPHFGATLENGEGLVEETWSYVLRHTQMRPRQLIKICNTIANRALRERKFPVFSNQNIVEGVAEAELHLANEILNSYSSIYPNVGRIISAALQRIPMVFDGRELDRRARQSAPEWAGDYSPSKFRQLVAEVGVVGRVTRGDEDAGYIDADFEYSLPDRLDLTHRDTCVVHPMFNQKLNVVYTGGRVMPFSTKRP